MNCQGPGPRHIAILLLFLALLTACGGGGGAAKTDVPPAPAPADFSLVATPATVQIPAGGSAYITVTLSRLSGFSGAVALSGAGLPVGVVASGIMPADSTTLQLPIAVDPGVAAATFAGTSLQGQSGSLLHSTPLALTVAAALPSSHLRTDLVQAAGGRQAGGNLENHAVAREGLPASTVKDANDSTRLRHGFDPTGTPTHP